MVFGERAENDGDGVIIVANNRKRNLMAPSNCLNMESPDFSMDIFVSKLSKFISSAA